MLQSGTSRWLARRRVTHPVAPHRQGHCSKSDGHRKNSKLLLARLSSQCQFSTKKSNRGRIIQGRARAKATEGRCRVEGQHSREGCHLWKRMGAVKAGPQLLQGSEEAI